MGTSRFARLVRPARAPWRAPRAFLSSTSLDLADHRRAVAATLRDAGLEVVTMDQFPAMASSGQAGSAEMVSRADVLFGIYARRYGTVGSDGVSITEHEYQTAAILGIPRVCFLLRDTAEWPDVYTETGASRTALDSFLSRVRAEVTVGWFDSIGELQAVATASAAEYLGHERRRAWRRFAVLVLGMAAIVAASALTVILAQARPELSLEAEFVAPAGNAFEAIAVRPDARDFATGHEDGQVLLWRSGVPREVARMKSGARAVAFLNATTVLVAAGKQIGAFELGSGRRLWQHQDPADIRELAIAPPHVAFGTSTGDVGILGEDGALLQRHTPPRAWLSGHGEFGLVKGLAYAPDGDQLAIAYLNGPVAVLDTQAQRFVIVTAAEHAGANSAVTFPDRKTIVLGHQEQRMGTVFVLTTLSTDGGRMRITQNDNTFWAIEPITQRRIVTADWNGRVVLWDIWRGTVLAEYVVRNPEATHEGLILDVAVGNSGGVDIVTAQRVVRLRERWHTVGGYPLGSLSWLLP